MDIDAFTDCLDGMMDRVPAPLLRDLNGGVTVSDAARRRRGDPPGVYILGEYVTDPHLGALVVLYHGSFARLFAHASPEVWRREMWDTLRHELRHHIEGQAGVDDLDVEDARDLARMAQDSEREATRFRVRGNLPRHRRR